MSKKSKSQNQIKSSLSIIIPTYNEKDNITTLIKEIFSILKRDDIQVQVVIVDDNSPDGTAKIAKELAGRYNVKVIEREGKLGLASAVMDGVKETDSEIIGVMDADLSHDPKVLPKMVDAILRQKNELVVGSRYIKNGKIENWPLKRRIISWVAVLMAFPFTRIKDRTSGYFLFRREVIEGVDINPTGFKIGLEIMVKGNYRRWKEVAYTFRDRRAGESKLTSGIMQKYIKQLAGFIFYKKPRKMISEGSLPHV